MTATAHRRDRSAPILDRPVPQRPKAIGFDMSLPDAPRRRAEIQRHAERMGFQYIYTVRPPADYPDPIGYAIGIALGVKATAIVVYDLETVAHSPARVCERFDLETVCPPETWSRAMPAMIHPAHRFPDHRLTVPEAQRIMQRHIECRALECPRKATALRRLVEEGKILPPATTPRERAAERGIPFRPIADNPPPSVSEETRTMLNALDNLADDMRRRRR